MSELFTCSTAQNHDSTGDSPSVKNQVKRLGSSIISPSSRQSTKGTEHEEVQSLANSPTNAKPTSVHVQKLIDKGFAKEQSHPTNRIFLTSNRLVKSSANVSKGPSLAGQRNEQTDKLKGKSVRQTFVNRSSLLTSPTSESVSSTSAATGPTISAAKFYLSKVSKQGKIKVNPTSTFVPASKIEKHLSSPNYSILKKKEVSLTGTLFEAYMNHYNILSTCFVCLHCTYIKVKYMGVSVSDLTFVFRLLLSTVVLNSRDWSEIVWLPEISCFKNQPCNRLYLKKPTGMHWLGYNDAVSWLNEVNTRIFQPTANFENFEIYLYFVCQPACHKTQLC